MLTRSARGFDGAALAGSDRGGQLLQWRSADGVERLFVASRAGRTPEQAIRGGIPVIFPQFGERGELPRHGLVRTADWHPAPPNDLRRGAAELAWVTESSPRTRQLWPYEFALRLSARACGLSLAVTLDVTNTGGRAFRFQAALHTYLACTDVQALELRGLVGCAHEDSLAGGRRSMVVAGPLRLGEGGIDRVYFDTPSPLVLSDGTSRLGLHAEGFPDTVVWNPGPEQAAALPELAEHEWRRFLCVEAAVVEHPVELLPGVTWRGRQVIEVL